ncbi:tape measure protein [Enterococcus sp. LJL99]
MADGRVVIEIELNDGQVIKGVANVDKQLQGIDPSAQKATRSVKDMVTALGLVKLASAGFDLLKQSMDAAISRFDTMNRYPKVMKSLGYSTDESTASVKKLADGIDGLPTTLDEVVSTSQRMTAITGNLNKSTDATIALNNAMLASGASTSDASRGLDQYVQMLSTGTVDLQSWKTLQETMPIGLQKTAEAMGFVGETAQRDLYAALKEGTITFKDFQNQLIELGTGTGQLAEMAKVNSEGIATSFGNLRNAAAKGIANILTSLDKLTQKVTGKNIAQNIDSLKVLVNGAFAAIGKVIEGTTPILIVAAKAFSALMKVIEPLTPAIVSFVATYATLKIIESINQSMKQSVIVTKTITAAIKLWELATQAQARADLASLAASKLSSAAMVAKTAIIGAQITMTTALAGTTGALSVATGIATAATIAFNAAVTLLTGPIGIATAAIGGLVAIGATLWKWFNKETEASKKLNKEQEALADSTKTLADTTKTNTANRQESVQSIESNTKAYKDMATSVDELANKENKTRGEKKQLKDQVEQLNTAYAGLNLLYDQETGKLSMSAEAIRAKIDAYGGQEKVNETQEQLVEIMKEQNDVEAKLKENAALREEWNQKLEDGSVKGREAKAAFKELDEQEKILKETQVGLKEEYQSTQEALKQSSEAVAAAEEESAQRRVVTYESLSEAQKAAVDAMKSKWQEYSDSARDMFNTLSDEQTLSTEQMIANMQENQRVIGDWANNIAILSERGINEGLLNKLRDAGPESAGHVAALVNSSDEQLARMNEIFDNGGKTATDALKTAFDTGKVGVDESVMGMVANIGETTKNKIDAADFKNLGKAVPDGIAGGVEGNSDAAANAVGDMADDMEQEYRSKTDTHSPSRIYHKFGENLVQGLTNGVTQSLGLVQSAINSLSESLKRPFDGLNNEMYQIGAYAMQGFANGLSANASSVYSTAQSIADNVKNTIQKAMDINSPSRWMKNFIGKNMMVGWSDGLEKYGQMPINAMKKAVDMVKMPVIRAEQVMGNMPSLNIAGAGNTSNSTTNHYSSSYEGLFKGANLNVRSDEDIPKLAKAVVEEMNRFNPNRDPGIRRSF